MPRRSIKILIVAQSAVLPTGTAEVTRLIFGSLLRQYPGNYELHQLGLKHVHAVVAPEWPIHPTKCSQLPDGKASLVPYDLQGEETFFPLVDELKPDLVFAFNDPQHLEYLCQSAGERKHKLIIYTNFDGYPVPGFARLLHADQIVTMSEFARRAFLSSHPFAEPRKVHFVYAPADVNRFRPVSNVDKALLRKNLLPPWMPQNAFVLGWVGINQWRKQNWALYETIQRLRTGDYYVCANCEHVTLTQKGRVPLKKTIDCQCCGSNALLAEPIKDIFLWMHMAKDLPGAPWPVEGLETVYDARPGRDIYYTDGCNARAGLAPEDMPILYQLWDALLYLSGGEGFGVPAWEAMATECPIVYTDYSSHAELVGTANAGLAVCGILQPEPLSCILRLVPNIASAIQAVRQLYQKPEKLSELGRNGRAFAQMYDVPIQAQRWHQLFQSCLGHR